MEYDDYFVVQAKMVTELGLSGNKLLIYALIHGFCKDGVHEFRGSLNYLCDWTNLSKNTVISVLKSLVNDELLCKREYTQNGVKFCAYSLGKNKLAPPEVEMAYRSAKIEPPVQNQACGSSKTSHNNIKDNIYERIEDTIISSKKEKKKFVKPTIEEIQAYIIEKGYTFDAEAFFAYYESNGWKVGRNPMKNWRMACTTWSKNRNNNNSNNYGRVKTNSDRFIESAKAANEFSQMLRENIGKQTELGDGDSSAVW